MSSLALDWRWRADSSQRSAEAIKEAVQSGAHSIWITVDTTIVSLRLCGVSSQQLGKRAGERRLNAEANPAPNGAPLNRDPPAWG